MSLACRFFCFIRPKGSIKTVDVRRAGFKISFNDMEDFVHVVIIRVL